MRWLGATPCQRCSPSIQTPSKIWKSYCSTSKQRYGYWYIEKYLSPSGLGLEMKYSVVLHKDPQSDYSVTVPDLPGCFSAGSTIEEALTMVKEAIECHIEGMFLDGEFIPKLLPFEEHQASPKYSDDIWGIVEIDISQLSSKSKRINIMLPEYLLDTVDNYARKHGETRSGLLAHAITEYLSSHQ